VYILHTNITYSQTGLAHINMCLLVQGCVCVCVCVCLCVCVCVCTRACKHTICGVKAQGIWRIGGGCLPSRPFKLPDCRFAVNQGQPAPELTDQNVEDEFFCTPTILPVSQMSHAITFRYEESILRTLWHITIR